MGYDNVFGNKKTTTVKEPVTINASSGVIEVSAKNLPIVKESGSLIELNANNLSKFKVVDNTNLKKINAEILDKVKLPDCGDLGNGITEIMVLANKVDINSLSTGGNVTGLFGKLRNAFGDNKTRVLSQFNSASTQIKTIVTGLEKNLVEMESEKDWLLRNLEETKIEVTSRQESYDALKLIYEESEQRLEKIIKEGADIDAITDLREFVDAASKELSNRQRLLHVATLTIPEIKSMLTTNRNNIEKYNTLVTTTVPMWEKKMGAVLISTRQRKATESAQAMDDYTDQLIAESAKLVGSNMVASTKSAQRSVVGFEALEEAQTAIINSLKESMAIEDAGRKERKETAVKIENMRNDLENTLRTL